VKLYFKPGACSLSPHIVLREAGLPFDLVKVDTKAGKTASGEDFARINPKGYVPALQLDDGEVLTEGVVIVQYIADRKPETQLAPKAGSMERYRLAEWLNYVATEIHKGGSAPRNAPPEVKDAVRAALEKKYAYLAGRLESREFLLGERFTVADAYLFTTLTWSNGRGIELEKFPALKRYSDRIAARPTVREALAAERA
jgi:glutathione S-transferase